jgi:N-acetylmuramoyl-L-alanine amidase
MIARPFAPDSPLVDAVVTAVNVEPRRGIETPTMLVQHYTGMQTAAKAIQWLACAESRVSCHYVIDEAGRITQLVPERLRAWHAGVSCWHGEKDLNSASVGIEIHNPGHEDGYWDFPDAQIAAVIALSADIIARHSIRADRVVAHSDIAPLRKIDPGEKFPWHRLAAAGVGHWVEPSRVRAADAGFGLGAEGAGVRTAQELLSRYGYDVPVTGMFDRHTAAVVTAFQRHFRPARCDGRFDLSTLATLERLLAALPPPLIV